MRIPPQIEYMLRKLNASGYEAYLVGGCVRDFLLHGEPYDYDITTSATPNETMAVFESDRVIPTGLKHGTVTVLYDGVSAEITTFRTETTYSDGRHPDEVAFSKNISDDLCRRDFTVNAMAMGLDGMFVDLYGGEHDLTLKVIRAVGDAKTRFTEDALRILRAFRFAAKLDFDIEENTLDAAIFLAKRLSFVSRERICDELCKLLCGKKVGKVLEIMHSGKVLDAIFEKPEINTDAFSYIDTLPCRADVRLAAILLYDENVSAHVASLKTSAVFAESVRKIAECRLPLDDSAPALRRFVLESGKDACLDRALIERESGLYGKISSLVQNEDCFSVTDLKVNGSDVAKILNKQGKEIGDTLKALLLAVFDEKVTNNREELIDFLKKVDNT